MIALGCGFTLTRYLALTFLRWIGGFFLIGSAIIFLADTIELIRRSVDRITFSAGEAVMASLLKTPSLTEEFLPFAVLFGAIAAFLALNRRLELAVMRAAGVSAWQFVMPAIAVVAALGLFATLVYNPLSAAAREMATTQPTVSKHLRVLEEAGLVLKRSRGTSVECSIADESLVRLCEAVCDRIRAAMEVADGGRRGSDHAALPDSLPV